MSNRILTPTPITLAKYGLTEETWQVHLDRQGGVCGHCGRVPPSKRLNIDHEHVKGWKAMAPEKRAQYVRGLVCYIGNKTTLARGATVENLRRSADYLERYEERKRRG